ncbi:MAG TPA: M14 metallopeptidase family protein [Pyrinomonadaceae bacterium]|nr:M14 metallopeptidase family protein [Pyrinomonadaceae bacterium]
MRTRILVFVLTLAFVLPLLTAQTKARLNSQSSTTSATNSAAALVGVPSPEDVLSFVPGDDRKLASWSKLLEYFTALAKASDRVRFETLGQSTMGKPFVMATISAPENLARLDHYRKIQELLADPRKLGDPRARDRKAAELIKHGKTIVLITCGIHSTEVGSYLSSMLIAHRLASASDANTQTILHNTIILLVPSLNPDGVDIVKDWYDKTLGTPYEGTSPPELYHKYTGHDDNRDWYAFTQVETQLTVDKIHNAWHPQIVHDIHQQGEFGARLFLPPYTAPVEPNVPKQIVEGYTELGNFIAGEMRAANFTGITTNSTYDAWSPSRAYSHYHGGVRILSETASCKIATPITVKFAELKKDVGYDPKKESANYGPLWRGGEWHLRDITNHMTTAAFLLLRHAAENREQWLKRFYDIGRTAVTPRKKGDLFAFIVPEATHQADLFKVLDRAWVDMDFPLPFTAAGVRYPQGTAVIRLDQPYSSFAKALLENQQYPDLRDQANKPISPYDATAHTLSLLMGVTVRPVRQPFVYKLPREGGGNGVGGFGQADEKVGIYKSHVPVADEGWTRWVSEQQHYTVSTLEDAEIRMGGLNGSYNSIVIPDQKPEDILKGHKAGAMPTEYTGGVGERGVKALREFVEQGGTLVCLNRASSFAIEQFKLPVHDVVEGVSEKEFFVPGSILRIELDTSSPLAQGMPKESIAWVEDSPVFEVVGNGRGSSPTARDGSDGASPTTAVRIIARYPADKTALLSGWLLGERLIKGKAALIEVKIGKGRIILFGFRPQYRAQSLVTYPLFFNAINSKLQ